MRHALAALLAVALAGCDAAGPSAPPSPPALAAADGAATVGCLLSEGRTAGTLVDTGGEVRVVTGPVSQAGCVVNARTGVLQYTVALSEVDTPPSARVITGADAPGVECGTVFEGEVVLTRDFTVVNTPSGLSKAVCHFHPPDPG